MRRRQPSKKGCVPFLRLVSFLPVRRLSFDKLQAFNMRVFLGCFLLQAASLVWSLKVDPREVDYNLNQNETAESPVDYWGEWPNHEFYESPSNWRFPFYSLFLDRFSNGDPSNDDANGTLYEHDILSNQFRYGGDLAGLTNTLDYVSFCP